MKMLAMLALVGALTACTSETQYGKCIGINGDKEPNLRYEVSGWNVFLAVFFFETAFTPIIVLFNETHCPIGTK